MQSWILVLLFFNRKYRFNLQQLHQRANLFPYLRNIFWHNCTLPLGRSKMLLGTQAHVTCLYRRIWRIYLRISSPQRQCSCNFWQQRRCPCTCSSCAYCSREGYQASKSTLVDSQEPRDREIKNLVTFFQKFIRKFSQIYVCRFKFFKYPFLISIAMLISNSAKRFTT